jgi:hypothetical protein
LIGSAIGFGKLSRVIPVKSGWLTGGNPEEILKRWIVRLDGSFQDVVLMAGGGDHRRLDSTRFAEGLVRG